MAPPNPIAGKQTGISRSPGRVAVLGGGISGLVAAWRLQQRGIPVDLYEFSGHVGGVLQSVRKDGWLVERGPNSVLENSAAVTELIESVGLGARRCRPGAAGHNRYIVRGGRLVAMPSGPLSFATSGLFGLNAKIRMMSEPWRGKAKDDESIASFVSRRLGREFLDYAVDPFVSGVYAGDPERLSVRQAFPKLYALERDHGSLFRGAFARGLFRTGPKNSIVSFPDGSGRESGCDLFNEIASFTWGKQTLIEVPWPGLLKTSITPSLCRMTPWTTAIPSPVPFPISFVVKKGSKM